MKNPNRIGFIGQLLKDKRLGAWVLAAAIVTGSQWASGQTSSQGSDSADATANNGNLVPGISGDGSTLNFQADLFTGRFSYTVPIEVAPGRQGAQPKLSLGYSSSGANGWCGVGWSLDVGCIQRDTRKGVPILWGSTTPLTSYDDSKGFIANFGGVSSPLVLVSSTNQNPIVYRQQVESAFMTYNYYTNDYWQVIDKSGNSYYFGEGITNQMENTKSNWPAGVGSSTFRWALDRVVDVNGNETLYNYETDFGALYLTNIVYDLNTNSATLAYNQVSFLVSLTNRSDTNISFISGSGVTNRGILTEIDVQANGAKVRKYVLGYTNSPSTTRSLLASVTQYGSDYSNALPTTTFNYQVQPLAFGPTNVWGGVYSQGDGSSGWNAIRAIDGSDDTFVETIDIDGDGLPDRVMRHIGSSGYTYFAVQRNTGSNFYSPPGTNYVWAPLGDQGHINHSGWGAVSAYDDVDFATYNDLLDINGDGYPDRVMRNDSGPYTNFEVELNSGLEGTNGFSADTPWVLVTNTQSIGNQDWLAPRFISRVDLIDMNGDGLPDRVSRQGSSPFDHFIVQLNNGTGFNTNQLYWGQLDPNKNGDSTWNTTSATDGNGNTYVMLADINGDGLPDRVTKMIGSPYTNFLVQFNNGAGFEPPQTWGPLNTQGNNSDSGWGAPIGGNGTRTFSTLVDINGDGLPDRVMRVATGTYTNWVVQLNTGSGFASAINFGPLESQGQTGDGWNDIVFKIGSATVVDFFDINGDGLPDRVMQPVSGTLDHFLVQTNEGPFPDLMCTVSNGLGGATQISYVPSTSLDNRSTNWTGDPWAAGTKSLLPFNVWVVNQIVTSDGMGKSSTNSYAFTGGYYNTAEREFRGFCKATVTDPLGMTNITYFHQSGGRDQTALGEYQDQGSESKKGIPFRTDFIGTNGSLNKVTLNKVQEFVLNTNGCYFPAIVQTIVMDYEGLSSYRATAKQFTCDTNTGNIIEEADFGEVGSVTNVGQTFVNLSTSDDLYTFTTYASLSNPNIVNKPSDMKITSDSGGSSRLRETRMSYDSRGNLTNTMIWLDTAGGFISTVSTAYDQYGNPNSAINAAGITTTTVYDPIYEQYPITQITGGTFTNSLSYDSRSGLTIAATDAKGLVASNTFDVFFRNTGTYISTNSSGPPAFIWKTKMSYSYGPISGGITTNYTYKQMNNAVDPVNGFQSYAYFDGLGRTIQTRSEAETGQFRVANTVFDLRGNTLFQTIPYFTNGPAFTSINGNYLGSLTEYDVVGRPFRVTPAVSGSFTSGSLTGTSATGGDSSSPAGPVVTAFVDGSNPWAAVVTDANGNVKKAYRDPYGRTIQITEVTTNGNYNTIYAYDLLGDLTNVTDNAGNKTVMVYDSLGRKTSTTDQDMGTWTYTYDNSGRMTQQIDACTNKLTFTYSDVMGRLTSKQIYNSSSKLVGTVTYTYDSSDDTNYTIFKGQLYKVTDPQGYHKSGYDIRGRLVKSDRHLNVNSMDYVTQSTYDDADHLVQLVYPNNAATIAYSYDKAGNLNQVRSLAGTGTQEIFYTPTGFNAFDQVTGYTNGNGVVSAYSYYPNSTRLQNITTSFHATNYQNLTYGYDSVSDVASVNDAVTTNGAGSGTLNNIVYDNLYRLVSLNSTANGTKVYGYDSIGNILTNQDFGSGLYKYGSKPHAVTNANGISYSYDACGNMVARGNQILGYDAENHLISVSDGATNVTFGYGDGGIRLWRCGTNGYSVWIGGLYEINNGKVLCHVFAGNTRIATFEPICGGPWAKAVGEKRWFAATTGIDKGLIWPLQKLGAPMAMVALALMGIIGVCIAARRQSVSLPERFWVRRNALYYQVTCILSICVFIFVTTPDVYAQTYNPVFYYYHADRIGSSSVLTDRSGNLVQHYGYSSFGQTSYQNNTSAFPVSNLYTGQVADDETGLYYYGSRYYDPQLGRFIQADTVVPGESNPQALNRYAYCDNNPLNQTDPNGHGFFSQVAGFFSAVFNAEAAFWTSGNVWKNIGIAFGIGGPGGGIGAIVIGHASTEIGASLGYIFGPKVGRDASIAAEIVGTIVMAALGEEGTLGDVTLTQQVLTAAAAAASVAASSAELAGDQGLSDDFGYASLAIGIYGAAASGTWSHAPLLGGMIGSAENALAGIGQVVMATATFGTLGSVDMGLEQLASGVGNEMDILSKDIEAAVAGVTGKIYVTVREFANLLTFGTITGLGQQWMGETWEPTGPKAALVNFVVDLPVPCYGNFNGPGWGVPNFGYAQELVINQGDWAAYWHDQTYHDAYWLRDWLSPNPQYQWTGPIGIAFFLFGVPLFSYRAAFVNGPTIDLENAQLAK